MPTTLTSDILTAAITGFEAQKKRINDNIAELRAMLTGASTDGATPPQKARRKVSKAARARMAAAQRARWATARKTQTT